MFSKLAATLAATLSDRIRLGMTDTEVIPLPSSDAFHVAQTRYAVIGAAEKMAHAAMDFAECSIEDAPRYWTAFHAAAAAHRTALATCLERTSYSAGVAATGVLMRAVGRSHLTVSELDLEAVLSGELEMRRTIDADEGATHWHLAPRGDA